MRRRAAVSMAAISATAAFAGLGSACSLLVREPLVPMPVLREAGSCSPRASTLVVMLPGAYSPPQEFVDEGFITAMRSRGIRADVLVADAHLGYFQDRSALTRLRDDVIGPARAQGYTRVWLVGISLGGFAALGYAARHGSQVGVHVDGVVALAPYLGPRRLLREIADVGGPAAWRATATRREADDLEHDLWQWLSAPAAGRLPVYLGFGTEDRLAQAHRLLAGHMRADPVQAERVAQVGGGHDWPPWRALWMQWLGRELLQSDCSRP